MRLDRCPQKRKLRLERHPSPGIIRRHGRDRLLKDCSRKQTLKERALKSRGRQNGQFSKGAGVDLAVRRERGEEGTSHEIQTRGLNIDPWQDTRTNRDGSICEIRDKNTVTAKRLPAPTQGTLT